MLNGNLFNKALIYFLILILLVVLGALLDLSAQTQQICLVTVDAKSNKNMILWEPLVFVKEVNFNILKETSTYGVYTKIGTVPIAKAGKFIDSSSDPSQVSNRYKIEVTDLEGKTMGISEFHQNIHLVLTKGLPGTYNLMWTPYIGFDFDSYYIYKGYSKDQLVLYDSLANTYNQYSDSSDRVTYYQIAVRKTYPCYISNLKSGAEPVSQSVSNLEDNLKYFDLLKNEILENKIRVYPNPFNTDLTIELFLEKPEEVTLEFYNNLGQYIYSYSSGSSSSGTFKYTLSGKISSMNAGFYIVKALVGDKTYYSKILKNGIF